MRIFVGAVSYDLKEDEIKADFDAYGKVDSASLIVNWDVGF